MDLTPYVDRVRDDLLVATEAAGEQGRAVADRLVAALGPAMRLTLLNALSAAADEITRELAPGSVDLRLRGLEPGFVVTPPPVDEWADEANGTTVAPSPVVDDESATARINFRPPESLKIRIEEAAGREGLSVNAWLVRAIGGVLDATGPRTRKRPSGGESFSGWVH